ncbi:MFS transporter [Actinomycetota bacterium]|nr:MFS transporter [Actinomycetota bacterium]
MSNLTSEEPVDLATKAQDDEETKAPILPQTRFGNDEDGVHQTCVVRSRSNDERAKAQRAAQLSIFVLFGCFGFMYITYLGRLVHIRELLGGESGPIDPRAASFLLLGSSLGSVVAAPIAGAVIDNFSIRKFIRITATLSGIFLVLLSVFATAGQYYLCVLDTIILGAMFSSFNIGINIAGVTVEGKSGGKTLMPKFHAFFQVGAVLAAWFSTLIIAVDFTYIAQCLIVALIALVISNWRIFSVYKIAKQAQVYTDGFEVEVSTSFKGKMKAKGLDLMVIMIGLMVLSSSLMEGSGNDWISGGIVEGFDSPESTGLVGMWVYLATTAAMRFFGTPLLDKFGRWKVMRVLFLLAFAGISLYIFSPTEPLAVFGCVLWGLGVSFGYPVGITAAAESGKNSSFRASIVASIGNIMNIAGPPVIGLLANDLGIRLALCVLLPFAILGFGVSHWLWHKNITSPK